MTPIVVALIGAIGTIVAAFFGRKREENRPSAKQEVAPQTEGSRRIAPTPRPSLVFACIFGAGIGLTALAVALWPRTVETLYEARGANAEYDALETGWVFAIARADPSHRSVKIDGRIGSEIVATTMAQDATVPGVPSIGSTSLVFPVSKGQKWRIETERANETNVLVKLCTTRTKMLSW
jgi:hypothetical protein